MAVPRLELHTRNADLAEDRRQACEHSRSGCVQKASFRPLWPPQWLFFSIIRCVPAAMQTMPIPREYQPQRFVKTAPHQHNGQLRQDVRSAAQFASRRDLDLDCCWNVARQAHWSSHCVSSAGSAGCRAVRFQLLASARSHLGEDSWILPRMISLAPRFSGWRSATRLNPSYGCQHFRADGPFQACKQRRTKRIQTSHRLHSVSPLAPSVSSSPTATRASRTANAHGRLPARIEIMITYPAAPCREPGGRPR